MSKFSSKTTRSNTSQSAPATPAEPQPDVHALNNRLRVHIPAREWEMFKRKAAEAGKEPNALLMEIIREDIQPQPLLAEQDAPAEPLAASYAPCKRIYRHIPFREWEALKSCPKGFGKLRSALRLKGRQRARAA